MKVSPKRWQAAQKFELNDWSHQPNIVDSELDEARFKYSKLFAALEKQLQINPKSKILDVGCSLTCISLLIKTGQHYGLEPLADKLEINQKVKGMKVLTGTGENIPFKSAFFDLVICRNVIDHTRDPDLVIQEISRVMKPKAYFFLAGYVYHPFITLVKKIAEISYFFRNLGHPHTYNPSTFRNLLRHLSIIDFWDVYTGHHPHDFGKIKIPDDNIPLIQSLVLFASQKLLKNSWFVKEQAILCQKK